MVITRIRTWRCTRPGCFARLVSDRPHPRAEVFHTHPGPYGMIEVPMRYEGEMWRP